MTWKFSTGTIKDSVGFNKEKALKNLFLVIRNKLEGRVNEAKLVS